MTDEMIQANKELFIQLVRSIERPNCNIDKLLQWLENSDFFVAPASAKYHNAIKGGLCQHSLNVYFNLRNLVHDFGMESEISEDTCKIVGLLHDLAKVNFYKIEYRNTKIYSDTGSKHDEAGRFDWVTVKEYGYVDDKEKFIFGNHESTSEYYIRQFIPLHYVESIAINHHHGNMSFDSAQDNIGTIWNRYPLSLLIFIADTESAFLNENTDGNVYYHVPIKENDSDEQVDTSTTSEIRNNTETVV